MAVHDEGQMAFDFDELARKDARSRLDERTGAPLRFTTDYYPPRALDEAFAHWCFLNSHLDSYRRSHMWHRSITERDDLVIADGAHAASTFTAELRPSAEQEGPGGLLTQLICEPCQWHVIDSSENRAVEAWHDHALPGWRELPVVPSQIQVRSEKGMTKLARAWIAEHYPPEAQVPGAPIITERARYATRHVRGYSPWGGYDLSHTATDDPNPELSPRETASRKPPAPIRAVSRSPAQVPARMLGL